MSEGQAISLSEAQAFCREVDKLFETVSQDLCKVSNLHYTHGKMGEQGLPDLEACANHVRSRMEQIEVKREEIARLTKLHADSVAAKELLDLRDKFFETNKLYVEEPTYELKVNDRWYRTRNRTMSYSDVVELADNLDTDSLFYMSYGSKSYGSGRMAEGDNISLDATAPTYFVVKN